ncbi:glycosyltransferase family 2 protein [Brytella acorum]|uniref:Glycosyltransferase family 2 protein n=1 Tax=Brytella acorum TaxID=2959299 RepID=A0AA35UX34_9PROT|nr:glycosyltransferase family 2 protein [Brytella acorum]MDF3625815.1 glycosyltransferase family 2 protein [Brytella acorum]CAI9121243.1 glycosyltransferase family 2 protein [Brytella acorum]
MTETHPHLLEPPASFKEAARTAFDTLRASDAWCINDNVVVDGLREAAILMLVKNVDDIIGVNLRHHYHLGFRRFLLLDNNSTDRTADIITRFRLERPDAGVLHITDFEVAYQQAAKMAALSLFAEQYFRVSSPPLRWLFFVDADEFITCCTRRGHEAAAAFNHVLADGDASVLLFNWAQTALYSQRHQALTQFGPTLGETDLSVWPSMKVSVEKVAVRTRESLFPTMGNHFVEEFRRSPAVLRNMSEFGFFMLHVPMRSTEQLRRKLEEGVRALDAANLHPSLGGHWRFYESAYRQDGDDALRHFLDAHIQDCL